MRFHATVSALGLAIASVVPLPVTGAGAQVAQIDPSKRGGAQETPTPPPTAPQPGSRGIPREAQTPVCPSLDRIRAEDPASIDDLIRAVRRNPSKFVDCDSVVVIISDLAVRTGPRRPAPTISRVQALTELSAASAQPGVRAQLDRMTRETQDDRVRLLYEAAILDEHGFSKARDLKIQELRRRLE